MFKFIDRIEYWNPGKLRKSGIGERNDVQEK